MISSSAEPDSPDFFLRELEERYKTFIQDLTIPMYEGLEGGELFKVLHHVVFESEELLENSSIVQALEELFPGDLLMFVSQRIDEEGEICPKWLITSTETGATRIREVYIASHKLERLEKDARQK